MSEVNDRYSAIADGFTQRVEGIPSEGWTVATPCDEWDVTELVAHVIGVHHHVIGTIDGAEAPEVDRAGDLTSQWTTAHAGVAEILGDPERAQRVVSGPFGEQPFETLVGRLLCADTLVHTWDLARATDQDEGLHPVGVRKTLDFLEPLDPQIRRPGAFSAKIDPGPDADDQTRLITFCGRATA